MSPAVKKLGLFVALLLLAACPNRSRLASPGELSEARALHPPPGSAVLYYVRESIDLAAQGSSVTLDGVPQGWLNCGDFFRFVLQPGPHRLESRLGNSTGELPCATPPPVVARPGDVFFATTVMRQSGGTYCAVDVFRDGEPTVGATAQAATLERLKGDVATGTLLLPDGASGEALATGRVVPAGGEAETAAAFAELALGAGGSSTNGPRAERPAAVRRVRDGAGWRLERLVGGVWVGEPSGPGPGPAGGPQTAPGATTPPAAFAAGAPQPNAFALVIGVEKYRDLPPPTGARGDAQRFAELARKTLGVPERNVILALDDRAAKSDLEKHLAWLEKNVPPGGRVYFFFAGHGAPEPTSGTSYLLPYDADPAALDGTALKLADVTGRLGRTKARDVVAFLDSCFSGTGGRSVIAAGTRPLVPVQNLLAAPKVSILAAVTGAQTSGAYSGGGGLFSHYLFEALGSGKADLDGDGQITLREVNDWIAPRVEREAKRDSRDQLPSLTPGAGVDPAQAVLAIGVTGG